MLTKSAGGLAPCREGKLKVMLKFFDPLQFICRPSSINNDCPPKIAVAAIAVYDIFSPSFPWLSSPQHPAEQQEVADKTRLMAILESAKAGLKGPQRSAQRSTVWHHEFAELHGISQSES